MSKIKNILHSLNTIFIILYFIAVFNKPLTSGVVGTFFLLGLIEARFVMLDFMDVITARL